MKLQWVNNCVYFHFIYRMFELCCLITKMNCEKARDEKLIKWNICAALLYYSNDKSDSNYYQSKSNICFVSRKPKNSQTKWIHGWCENWEVYNTFVKNLLKSFSIALIDFIAGTIKPYKYDFLSTHYNNQ